MEQKKLFTFSTRILVATALGAALFFILNTFVRIPTPVPATYIMPSWAIAAFFGALFGPITSALMTLIAVILSGAIDGGMWWSWIIAGGVAGFIYGFAFKFVNVNRGEFKLKGILIFNAIQIAGNVIAWFVVAPVLDILIYAEPVELVFLQGAVAGLTNIIGCAVIGTLLLLAYSATRSKEGSLKKDTDNADKQA
ncbi:MAG: ECF-type riboflavin transporter substrate-binding protein [Clostridiales Family XIII bacterium]|jgi:energy-coupling factor transport system substrate-specific component|nr:ECF-type riboflavin transporter substrate-binding protein [Clostridiales Family XIII bacterium]